MSSKIFYDSYKAIRNSACLFLPKVKIFEIADIDLALDLLAPLLTGRVSMLEPYKLSLSLILDEEGQMEELVYLMMFENKFWVLSFSDDNHIEELLSKHFGSLNQIVPVSSYYRVIGLEGPYSWKILKAVFGLEVIGLSPMHFMEACFDDREVIINRYSLSGETGYRIFVKNEDAEFLLMRLKDVSQAEYLEIPENADFLSELLNTVSTEMRIPHMNNGMINRGESPLENELRWMIRSEEDDYVGKDAVEKAAQSSQQRVVGFVLKESLTGQELSTLCGSPVMLENRIVGKVKYISYSPSIDKHYGYILFDECWGYVNIDEFYIDCSSDHYPVITQSTAFITTLSSKIELE